MSLTNKSNAAVRSGFTLIELLIVIALIGILAALVVSATMRIVGVQEGKTTETNILKLYSLLDQHWKAVIAKANSDSTIPDFAYKLAGKYDIPTPAPEFEKRARVIHIKLSLRQQFPVTFNELLGPNDMPGYPRPDRYKAAADFIVINNIFTLRENTEKASSILLYLALSQARSGVSMNADAILNAMDLQPIINASGLGYPDAKVIADSWGEAIVFSRWPCFDQQLNPSGAQPFPPWRDPGDPNGLLSDAWVNFPSAAFFDGKMYPVKGLFQQSYDLRPVIMSRGPDKAHGLDYLDPRRFSWLKVAIPAEADDNIYSYRLRMGGSGN